MKQNANYTNKKYYTVRFQLGNQIFEIKVKIGVDSNGNKHLYKVNNI